MTTAPRYLTPSQLAVAVGAQPAHMRDWLRHEPSRGRDHTAPPEHWISATQRTYDSQTAIPAWHARPGKGGRPSRS